MIKNLKKWLEEGTLKEYKSTKEEIAQLFRIVHRDLADAEIDGLSEDRRFATAYNAGLQLATILLRIIGLRTNSHRAGHHRISIDALPEILGENFQEISDYLNSCRIKRNICDYTNSGETTKAEADELIEEIKKLKREIHNWIRREHAHFSND
ncbi:MAG: hypothetical protein JSR58_01930 [Verrucomicrobia bacterium]|nr:hypothetical protein [Verrucomicrobiota bacterium]